MTIPTLREQVRPECKLIPRGEPPQSSFKMCYEVRREPELRKPEAERQTKAETIAAATADVRANDPTFQPLYDAQLLEARQ